MIKAGIIAIWVEFSEDSISSGELLETLLESGHYIYMEEDIDLETYVKGIANYIKKHNSDTHLHLFTECANGEINLDTAVSILEHEQGGGEGLLFTRKELDDLIAVDKKFKEGKRKNEESPLYIQEYIKMLDGMGEEARKRELNDYIREHGFDPTDGKYFTEDSKKIINATVYGEMSPLTAEQIASRVYDNNDEQTSKMMEIMDQSRPKYSQEFLEKFINAMFSNDPSKVEELEREINDGKYMVEEAAGYDRISKPVKIKKCIARDEDTGKSLISEITGKPLVYYSYEDKVIVRDEKDSKRYYLSKKHYLWDVEIIYGKGGHGKIDNNKLNRLMSEYEKDSDGNLLKDFHAKDWSKEVGDGWVEMKNGIEEHEIHWYRHPHKKLGIVDVKIKRRGQMYGQSKHGNQIECGAILTESGLLLDNGETITSGHILDRVKELDKLCNDKNWNGFLESYDDAIKTLSHKDYITLRDTLLPNFGDTVWCAQSDIYESLHPEQDIGKRKRTPIPPNFTGIPYEEYIKEHPEDFDNLE